MRENNMPQEYIEMTDPREFEKRKYNSVWQVLNAGNDKYDKYKVLESLIDGIEKEAYSLGKSVGKSDCIKEVEEMTQRVLDDTLAADAFVGFKENEWRACKVFAGLIIATIHKRLDDILSSLKDQIK